MKNSVKPPKTPLTRAEKLAIFKVCLIILLAATFTIINAVALIHNFTMHAENTQLLEIARAYQAQADYAQDCQLITAYLPELSPPLIRFQDDDDTKHLYYCTRVEVNNLYDELDNRWYVSKGGNTYESERIDLPSYQDDLNRTHYHAYSRQTYDNKTEYYLETHRIHQLGDAYYAIECDYQRVPPEINIEDANRVAAYVMKQPQPSFILNSIPLPHPSTTQTEVIAKDNENIIRLDPPKTTCDCGCTGCTCDDCKCTG